MKILLLGDASNCHRTLASGLRALGQEVTVASDGTGWMNTHRDIDIARHSCGKLAGLELWLRAWYRLHPNLRGYDIVAIHSPIFFSLRPHRVRAIFDRLRAENGAVFLTALGTDTPYVELSLANDPAMRYSEFAFAGAPSPYALEHPEIRDAWLRNPLRDHCRHIYDNVDGVVAVLYEYFQSASRVLSPDRLAYAGIPIDLSRQTPVELPEHPEKVRIFLGRHATRMTIKGTDRLEIAARRALERHPGRGELIIVENRPYDEYLSLLKSAHIVVDQAYSYSPATNALLAMAYGIPAISGAEPEYYDFIGEQSLRPIINSPLDVDHMTDMFERILLNPEQLRPLGLQSRMFVERHHSHTIVAKRFLDFWTSRLPR